MLVLESLEERTLLTDLSLAQVADRLKSQNVTGATIVTHGFQLSSGGGDSLMPLAQAICTKADQLNGTSQTAWLLDYEVRSDTAIGVFDVPDDNDTAGRTCAGGFASDFSQSILSAAGSTGQTGEVVLLFDWASESKQDSAGWGEAAGDALFGMLVGLGLVDLSIGSANMPLHFIGHSFGTVVTSEAVERLARFNVQVDQVTYLDPHDFDQSGISSGIPIDESQKLWSLGQPSSTDASRGYGATVWENVSFADVYYETRGRGCSPFVPEGRPIPGAFNLWLSDTYLPRIAPLQVACDVYALYDSDHSFVWNGFYLNTVNNPSGYGDGYRYSRVANPGVADPFRPDATFFPEFALQDHEHSSPQLVDPQTGQPNYAGLGELGLNPVTLTNRKWAPTWNPFSIVNGDFQNAGDENDSVPFVGSNLVPGWSHHGGGDAGMVEATESGRYYLKLDANGASRTHNWLYVPPVETSPELAIVFDLQRAGDGNADSFEVWLGSTALAGNPPVLLNQTDSTFTSQCFPIPNSLRGRVSTLTFELLAPDVNSAVRIDNVRFVPTDCTTSSAVSVVEVIDRSGSMGYPVSTSDPRPKLAAAQTAAKLFVDLMNPGDKIGVVSFNSSASPNFPLSPVTALQKLFADKVDSGNNWIATAPWGLTTSTSHSGGISFTDSPVGDYSDNANTSLTLANAVLLPPDQVMTLNFWSKYDLESNYDYGRIEVSTDGSSWTQIGSLTSTQSEWTELSYSLSSFAGQPVLVRFRLTSDSSVRRDGWYVDDVSIQTYDTQSDAKSEIDAITAIDGTAIATGIEAAYYQLDRFPNDRTRAMILLSDGEDDPCCSDPEQIIRSRVDPSVRVFTIGFGTGAKGDVLSELADLGGGLYFPAITEGDLQHIYAILSGLVGGQQPLHNSTRTIQQDQTESSSLFVDASVSRMTVGVNWSGSDLDLELIAPDGSVVNDETIDPDIQSVVNQPNQPIEYYKIDFPLPGQWEVRVTGVDVPMLGEPYNLFSTVDSPVTVTARTDRAEYQRGELVNLRVEVRDDAPILGATVVGDVTPPPNSPYSRARVVLYDDGAHNDGAANDGVYGNDFRRAVVEGNYTFQITVQGFANAGFVFTRAPTASILVTPGADDDGDGLPNVWEDREATNKNVSDSAVDADGDVLTNLEEFHAGTRPTVTDTDADGFLDGLELSTGTDPLDPASHPPGASVTGLVFEDMDGNGTKGANEQPLPQWTIFFDSNGDGSLNNPVSGPGVCDSNALERCTVTELDGNYAFGDLPPGTYRVRQVVPQGWRQTASPPTQLVLSVGQTVTDANFGNQPERNSPPILSPIPDKSINEGSLLSFVVSATDPDGDVLRFSLDPTAPPGARIDASTGLFTWTPTADQYGIHAITVEVADDGMPMMTASRSFTITVPLPFRLNRDAKQLGSRIELTNGTGQTSSAWFEQTIASDRFTATFTFELSQPAEFGWGDGFTFAIVDASMHSASKIGAGGGGLGYEGLAGTGMAIEFDTYFGNLEHGDPLGVHVGLDVAGSVSSVEARLLPFEIRGVGPILAEITIDSDLYDVSLTRPGTSRVSVLSGSLPPNALPTVKRVGFTAATASAGETVLVDSFQINPVRDIRPPDTIIDSAPPNSTNSNSAMFSFHATEAGSTFECKRDSGTFIACTSPVTYPGLAEGPHTFRVQAVDLAGNADPTPATFTWVVDTTPPTVVGTPVSTCLGRKKKTITAVAVTFSEAVDSVLAENPTAYAFQILARGVVKKEVPVASPVQYEPLAHTVHLRPAQTLKVNAKKTVQLVVRDSVSDLVGNPLNGDSNGSSSPAYVSPPLSCSSAASLIDSVIGSRDWGRSHRFRR